MLETIRLGLRRRRSPNDYLALQAHLSAVTIGQIEDRDRSLDGLACLEIGSGRGGYSAAIAERAASLVSVDLQHPETPAAPNVRRIEADAQERLPIEAGSIDFVFCSSVIEHVDRPDALLAEIHRVLRADGRLFLSFPPFYSLMLVGGHQFKPFHLLGEWLAVRLTNRVRGTDHRGYARCYGEFGLVPLTIREVRRMLEQCFTVRDVFTRGSRVNPSKLPPPLGDLLTWHVCFLASPKPHVGST